jgi:nickel/cobalt exporter
MNLTALVEQGNVNPLFLVGGALLLGALHGLEPGHSKTMMAAFIIAVRGTASQAVLLGAAAAFSHSIIVWVLALLALLYGDQMIAEEMEPWFMVVSGTIVIGIASWMAFQIHRSREAHHSHAQGEAHSHDHGHGHEHNHDHDHSHDHRGHHDHPVRDAHAEAHAREIERRFASGRASNSQVVWFGLTGGLIPCPAAVTVLIVCLHLQQFWLGVGLVGSFSVGLALTLILVGIVAAWGVSIARRKSTRFDAFFAAAPYVSVALIALIGALMIVFGITHMYHVDPAQISSS